MGGGGESPAYKAGQMGPGRQPTKVELPSVPSGQILNRPLACQTGARKALKLSNWRVGLYSIIPLKQQVITGPRGLHEKNRGFCGSWWGVVGGWSLVGGPRLVVGGCWVSRNPLKTMVLCRPASDRVGPRDLTGAGRFRLGSAASSPPHPGAPTPTFSLHHPPPPRPKPETPSPEPRNPHPPPYSSAPSHGPPTTIHDPPPTTALTSQYFVIYLR